MKTLLKKIKDKNVYNDHAYDYFGGIFLPFVCKFYMQNRYIDIEDRYASMKHNYADGQKRSSFFGDAVASVSLDHASKLQ